MARGSGNYSPQMQEAIRRRATKLYNETGRLEGRDTANWYQAEAEILRESAPHLVRRAVVVNVKAWSTPGNTIPPQLRVTLPANGSRATPSPSAFSATNSTSAAPTARNFKPLS
jgi:hypothetical protein